MRGGRLAGGIAHDVNNLLTVINGYTELLLRVSRDGDGFQESLSEIRQAGDRARELTSQMLSFSRKQILESELLSLSAVIADMETMLRRMIGEDIELITELGPGLHLIRVDRTEMTQVLLNLAANARDAMAGGGTLRLETRNVEVGASEIQNGPVPRPGSYVLLTSAIPEPAWTRKRRNTSSSHFSRPKKLGGGPDSVWLPCMGL